MRTENSIKNSITSAMCYIMSAIIGLISQHFFIKILGAECLGINGLFTNMMGMLNIFELGIGSAIIFHLYKPIAENDIGKIKSLMLFYKKAYILIAVIEFAFGILLIPFLNSIVGETTGEFNIYLIYILFLFQATSSYILGYKRSLLYANQKNYIINLVHFIYIIVINGLRLLMLYITKDYYIYLIIIIIGQLLENIIINIIVNRKYNFINEKNVEKIDSITKKDLFSKIKALMYHKVSYIVINSTDNIVISSFLGVEVVGVYSGYSMILTYVQNACNQIINSVTASVGNLIVLENKEKWFSTFKKIHFVNYYLTILSSIILFNIMQIFVELWLGKDYILSDIVLLVLVINYFQRNMRNSYSVFKDSAGIWEKDRFIPIVESILNIIISIISVKIFGLVGVFIGTLISALPIWLYSYPILIYKNMFKKSYLDFIKHIFKYILIFIILLLSSYIITTIITVKILWIKLLINLIVSIGIVSIIMFVLFKNTEEYKYIIKIIKNIVGKVCYGRK